MAIMSDKPCMQIDDEHLAEWRLASGIKKLVEKYMKDTGKEIVFVKCVPVTGPTLSFDSRGETVVWDRHDITVKSWTREDYLDMVANSIPADEDEEDDDE